MNSPWGLIAHIAEKFGYTPDYILRGTSWINLQLMLADAPKSVKTNKEDQWMDYDSLEEMEEASDDDLRALNG